MTGGAACYYFGPEAGVTTLGLTGSAATETAAPGEVAELSHASSKGRPAVEKALRSFQKRLAEHEAKLAQFQSEGGYTRKVKYNTSKPRSA